MKTFITLLLVGSILSTPATARPSLQDQINAVDRVHQQSKAREQAEIDAAIQRERQAQAAQERKQREQKAIARQQQAQKDQRAKEQQAKIDAQRAVEEQELLKDKERDQAYEDHLRKLAIEERQLEIEMQRSKVKRGDEYIDQELRARAAETDVMQSSADAVRSLSQGQKSLLEKEGESRVRKAGGDGWFD